MVTSSGVSTLDGSLLSPWVGAFVISNGTKGVMEDEDLLLVILHTLLVWEGGNPY